MTNKRKRSIRELASQLGVTRRAAASRLDRRRRAYPTEADREGAGGDPAIRQDLEALYDADPQLAFGKVLAEQQIDAATQGFLGAHAGELNAAQLVEWLGKTMAEGVARSTKSIAERLGELLPAAGRGEQIRTLRLAVNFDPKDWLHLVQRLQGLEKPLWYLFVDRVQGCPVFNALNVPPPGLQGEDFLGPVAQSRPEPLVVPLLSDPGDDGAARAHALALPMPSLLDVLRRDAALFQDDDVRSVLSGKVRQRNDRWSPPFPEFMAEYVVQRLAHAGSDEALDLYKWLADRPDASDERLLDLAIESFERFPTKHEWYAQVGGRLATPHAWSTQGRRVIEFCFSYNKGFPPELIDAALGAASRRDPERGSTTVLQAIHDVAAWVFVERAREALNQGVPDASKRALRALTRLNPSAGLADSIRALSGSPNVPEEIIRLVRACEQVVRSRRPPTERGLSEAFLVLSGQSS